MYYDGQFDDARLLINLVETAAEQGATLVNYVQVVGITKGADGFVDGVVAAIRRPDRQWTVGARVVDQRRRAVLRCGAAAGRAGRAVA